ncbi:MAG: 23S rRNA (uracil(1939)-C(5))-methyltransferase RlmD [Patescibacteria group bacterium]|jgi:23S rRNA (uracil-5-)-methyltransferase RumA
MKFGHRIQGKVEAYDDKGRGIFDLDGEKKEGYQLGKGRVAVPFSAVGDELDATFLKRDSGVKIAKIETIKTPGPDRIKPPCPHAGVCGGCLWQHLDYDAQLRLKKEMINRAFEKAGHEERVTDVMPSDDRFYYRNRMDYVVGWLGQLGLKEYGSWNRYLDLTACLLLNEDVPKILDIVRALIKEFDLEPWDAVSHQGLMRYVVIRDGKNTKERMVMLVVSDTKRIDDNVRAVILDRLGPFATSLLIGEQPAITDVSYVKSSVALKGESFFHEEVNGVRYTIAPNSFFQTNTHMAAKLQNIVLDHITDSKTLLDLYCGLGFFGIAAAKKYPSLSVHGFELDAEAISLASQNAETNGVADRCTFGSGPAEDLSWKELDVDTIILDPPRSGLHPRVVKTVLEKAPKTIVYVSCNFHRLVDELKEFKSKYRVESIAALDLFPQTPHVEVVTKLTLL